MLKEKRGAFNYLFRLADICILIAAFAVAYYVRFEIAPSRFDLMPLEFQLFLFAYLGTWVVSSKGFKLYVSKRFSSIFQEAWGVIKTIGVCFMIASVPAFFIRQHPISRLFLSLFLVFQAAGLITFRYGIRKVLRFIRLKGYDSRQVLIVGRNKRSDLITQRILAAPEYGIRILGCIDALSTAEESRFANYRMLGSIDQFEHILRNNVIDEVLVTLPIKSFYSEIEKILSICENMGIEVKLPTDFFSKRIAKSSVCNYYDYECIYFFTSPKMSIQLFTKRVFDVILSALGLISLLPLFAIVAVLIKATSEGPIFFVQPRIGYNGRLFSCIKFRTMVKDAPQLKKSLEHCNEISGPVFKIRNDPRITKVGYILRRSSIDELPQLINVLKGEMSLVGPRPPIPDEVQCYRIEDRRRLSMRPGLTCLWQVSGRNNVPFDKWMELDRTYIDQWSLWLDFKILIKTIFIVVKGEGAA